MPTYVGKASVRPSGRGIGVPSGIVADKSKWDIPRPFGMSDAGGSPSSSADTGWSRKSQAVLSDEESFDLEGETTDATSEGLLRTIVRETVLEDVSASDLGHLALDVAGLFPGVGEAADLTNMLWYLRNGQYLYGALSLISMAPEVGDAVAKSGKIANWLRKVAPDGVKAVEKYGPEIAQKILNTRRALIKYEPVISAALNKAGENEKVAKYVPGMREALRAFIGKPTKGSNVMARSAAQKAETKLRLRSVLESLDKACDKDEEPEVDEASAVGGAAGGAIRGYTLPLGMAGKGSRKKTIKIAKRTFGNAKEAK